MRVDTYGASGPAVILVHGGPGVKAIRAWAPVAHRLEDSFRVLVPLQRGSGGEPLTVARHIADLHELVESHCGNTRPALVGYSWGAMLTLAYAAEHPDSTGPLVLIGCGTFDKAARARLRKTLDERTDCDLRQRLERLKEEFPDPGKRMNKEQELSKLLYSYDPIAAEQEEEPNEPFDMRAHTETWNDMVRLQEVGLYPTAFSAIKSPVLMLHGVYDPHPGQMIRASLKPHIPHLEYREWKCCGHGVWNERSVRDEFFVVLHEWLTKQFPE